MSIYAGIVDGDQVQVATNKGWGDFCRWVETLEGANMLRQLCQHGCCNEEATAAKQLADAMQKKSPPHNIASVGHALAKLLADVPRGGTAYISNGMGPDDGKDDA